MTEQGAARGENHASRANNPSGRRGALAGLRVLDLSAVIAGPNCARYLADFGATCIKVERPDGGDSLRGLAWRDPADGEPLWWKQVNRNKLAITLDLKDPDDLARCRALIDGADVLVENFRPGILERLGLAPDALLSRNPRLVITRVTAFGQTGPYSHRPGFATIAESMSGLASISGEADGPPLLPPIALTDEVTALAAALATMVAVHSGVGQVVDVSLLESLYQMMSPFVAWHALSGERPQRLGSGLPYSVPRGTYRCADGLWVGLSASSERAAARLLRLLGLEGDARFATFAARAAHREEIDEVLVRWCAARTRAVVIEECERADVAVGPVLDIGEIASDPHFAAREAIIEVGGSPMQGLLAKLSATPGRLDWPGRRMGEDNELVAEHGWDAVDHLADEG